MEQSMGLSVTTQNAIVKKATWTLSVGFVQSDCSVVVVRSSDDNSYSLPIMGYQGSRACRRATTLLRSRWSVENGLLFAGTSPIPKRASLRCFGSADGKCPAIEIRAWLSVQQALQVSRRDRGALILKSAYGKASTAAVRQHRRSLRQTWLAAGSPRLGKRCSQPARHEVEAFPTIK